MSIEAMKQALEYIEATNKSSSFWMVPASELNKTVNVLRQAISEAEKRKPTAWIYKPHRELLWPNEVECTTPLEKNEYEPLYTASQPQREWVGLTDEQRRAEFAKLYPADDALLNLAENNRDFMVEAIGARHHWHAFQLGSKSTEAKLKEKNT